MALGPIAGCGGTNELLVPSNPGTNPAPSGGNLVQGRLEIGYSTFSIGGTLFTARCYNGQLPGPTFRAKPGDTLEITVVNNLPPNPDPVPPNINIPHHFNTTNLHFHGSHVDPSEDNIFPEIEPGQQRVYTYHIPDDQAIGTHWYHPHKHSAVAVQMFSGMAGFVIIEGGVDELPEVAAAKEVPVLLNELMIGNANGNFPNAVPDFTSLGVFQSESTRTFVLNGELLPVFKIRPGEVQRWRFLHAGVSQVVPLEIQGHTLHTIAYDGITYDQVLPETEVVLAPANRVDFLLKGGAPGTYPIMKNAFNQVGMNNTPAVQLGTLVVEGDPTDMPLPSELPGPQHARLLPIADAEITGSRTVTYDFQQPSAEGFPNFPVLATVDGVRFDPNVVGQTVTLGAVEDWTLVNPSPASHPFHIHINPFQVVSINGQLQNPRRWQDTVLIPQMGSVVIRHRFTDYTGKYVNHCHFLAHEDMGMMQVVEVVPPQ